MKTRPILIILPIIFILSTDISHAAGIIMRIQQMKKQRQQPQMTQEEYRAHLLEQQQQQQQQASQSQAPVPLTYQQTIDQRNQAIAQAIIDAKNKEGAGEAFGPGNSSTQRPAPVYVGAGQMPEPSKQALAAQTVSSNAQDVVDLSDVWKKLDKKSTVWTLLIDDQSKMLTVSEYIDRFRKQGVKINIPPLQYAQMIDQVLVQNPQMQERPFGELLQIMAIVNYDFDNGMNKDDLARKVLGEEGFEANKKRFTQQGK